MSAPRLTSAHTPWSRYSDHAMIAMLQQLAGRLGRTPMAVDLHARNGTPCHHAYYRRFGGVRAAQRLAGLATVRSGMQRATHCNQGHALTPGSCYEYPRSGAPHLLTRRCRICALARYRAIARTRCRTPNAPSGPPTVRGFTWAGRIVGGRPHGRAIAEAA